MARVSRQGKVEQVAAEQVNLGVRGTEVAMRQWRKDLADASVQTARHWTYQTPTDGPVATRQAWIVHVPVAFHIHNVDQPRAPRHGQWTANLPGTHQAIPWLANSPHSDGNADVLPAGGTWLADQRLHLVAAPKSWTRHLPRPSRAP